MSGQKVSYVQITNVEYDRLMSSAREVEKIDSKISKELRQNEQSLREEMSKQLENINKKSVQQESNLKRLDQKVETLIEEIEAREANKRSQATSWLIETSHALEVIKSYRHEKFSPGRLEDLHNRNALAQSNFENGVYEASISSAQAIWQDAKKLQKELDEKEQVWKGYFEASLQINTELLATCSAQETLELAFDVDDDSKSLMVDIDYWCDGALSQVKDEALKVQKELQSPQALDIEDLKERIKRSHRLKDQALQLTQKAKEAIILSQLRSDMASDIVEALDESGFELEESCFDSEDDRRSLHLKLTNRTGDEIVTIISPVGSRDNKLDIHFFDKDSDENFKKTRLNSIFERLSESGVDCDAPSCAPGTENESRGNEEVRNFEKIKVSKIGKK